MEVIKLFKGITRYLWVIRRYPLNLVDDVIEKNNISDDDLNALYVIKVELTGDKETDILKYLTTNK